jgi:hypothetical protein
MIVLRSFGPCRYFYDLLLPITPLVYNKLFFHNFFWAICLYIFFSLLLETKPNWGSATHVTNPAISHERCKRSGL